MTAAAAAAAAASCARRCSQVLFCRQKRFRRYDRGKAEDVIGAVGVVQELSKHVPPFRQLSAIRSMTAAAAAVPLGHGNLPLASGIRGACGLPLSSFLCGLSTHAQQLVVLLPSGFRTARAAVPLLAAPAKAAHLQSKMAGGCLKRSACGPTGSHMRQACDCSAAVHSGLRRGLTTAWEPLPELPAPRRPLTGCGSGTASVHGRRSSPRASASSSSSCRASAASRCRESPCPLPSSVPSPSSEAASLSASASAASRAAFQPARAQKKDEGGTRGRGGGWGEQRLR